MEKKVEIGDIVVIDLGHDGDYVQIIEEDDLPFKCEKPYENTGKSHKQIEGMLHKIAMDVDRLAVSVDGRYRRHMAELITDDNIELEQKGDGLVLKGRVRLGYIFIYVLIFTILLYLLWKLLFGG